jgi:hypothetical protein
MRLYLAAEQSADRADLISAATHEILILPRASFLVYDFIHSLAHVSLHVGCMRRPAGTSLPEKTPQA